MCTGRHKPDDTDWKIASRYAGIDRDYLRFVRGRYGHCNSGTHVSTSIYVEDSLIIQRLLIASRALKLGSHSSIKSTTILNSKSRSESTDPDVNAILSSLGFHCSSVF